MDANLLKAAKDALAELESLTHGERCDHSVGICWCECFERTEALRIAIADAEAVRA